MHAEICFVFHPRRDHVVADIQKSCFFIDVPPLAWDLPVGPPDTRGTPTFKVEFPDGPPGFPPRGRPAKTAAWLQAEGLSAEAARDLQVLASVERLTAYASDGLRSSLQETVRGLTQGLHLPDTIKIHV